MKNIAIGAGFLAALISAVLISSRLTTKHDLAMFGPELEATQVGLWIDHLKMFEEIQSNLENGCNSVALENAKNGADQELSLLAETLNKSKDRSVIEYANELQPGLVGRLAHFKSRHGSAWDVPVCKPAL
jgi:hypothetical protein